MKRNVFRGARSQAGSFLLEALVAVLLVAFGVLGLVALLARSMQNVDESKYRGEAAFLANAYIGQMWVADKATLVAHFSDGGGGAEYAEFKTLVHQRLPNAADPVVTVTSPGPTLTSSIVQITLQWRLPGSNDVHQQWATGTIGTN